MNIGRFFRRHVFNGFQSPQHGWLTQFRFISVTIPRNFFDLQRLNRRLLTSSMFRTRRLHIFTVTIMGRTLSRLFVRSQAMIVHLRLCVKVAVMGVRTVRMDVRHLGQQTHLRRHYTNLRNLNQKHFLYTQHGSVEIHVIYNTNHRRSASHRRRR